MGDQATPRRQVSLPHIDSQEPTLVTSELMLDRFHLSTDTEFPWNDTDTEFPWNEIGTVSTRSQILINRPETERSPRIVSKLFGTGKPKKRRKCRYNEIWYANRIYDSIILRNKTDFPW